jgi:hypothetical protein
MIGPAEIEDMRLDLLAMDERARLYDAALVLLNRHWEERGAASIGSVTRICELVFARAEDRPLVDWKAVVTEAVEQAGFGIVWNGDAVASLEAHR